MNGRIPFSVVEMGQQRNMFRYHFCTVVQWLTTQTYLSKMNHSILLGCSKFIKFEVRINFNKLVLQSLSVTWIKLYKKSPRSA